MTYAGNCLQILQHAPQQLGAFPVPYHVVQNGIMLLNLTLQIVQGRAPPS